MEYQQKAEEVHDGLHELADMLYQLENHSDNEEVQTEAEIQKGELRRMASILADYISHWKYSEEARYMGFNR